MSTLVDMVNMRFGSKASALSIRACELRQDDIIADVIRDGDLVEVIASGSSETWTSLNQAIHDGSSLVSSNMGSPTIVRLPPKLALLQPAPGVDHSSAKGGPTMSMPIEARYRQIQRFTGYCLQGSGHGEHRHLQRGSCKVATDRRNSGAPGEVPSRG